ncbi:MAG: hypothetical protein ACMUEL_01435 [Flavobacteriales bacterium Tduv]
MLSRELLPTSDRIRRKRGKSKSFKEKQRQKNENQSGVDTQEKWLKKSGKLYYGYKKHIEEE